MKYVGRTTLVGLLALALPAALTACVTPRAAPAAVEGEAVAQEHSLSGDERPSETRRPAGSEVTLAFAGDMHFELSLAGLLDHPQGALGPIVRTLRSADVSMVNLETAITSRGTRLHADYAFRTSPRALRVLAAAGIDVATMANNHGVDYGPVGLRDTLRAVHGSPIPVIGIGADREAAFAPFRVTVKGTAFSFLAASSEPDQLARSAAGPTKPGIAAAFGATPQLLLDAVRAASARGDVVVVYLHWGKELETCPTRKQLVTAQALASAGADVVVGSHAHVLLGAGWLGRTYVDYGLGNFLWYHDHQPETGVLQLRIRDGAVVDDSWEPARIRTDGRPHPLAGDARSAAVDDWRRLRGCTNLAASEPAPAEPALAYQASVQRISPELQARMRHSYRIGCPVPLADLRYLRIPYVGFDDKAHTGEMVIRQDVADDVMRVFRDLYEARWPIARMRLVDEYGGADDRSMAANNTSGFNCRQVAGEETWSEHAYGAAIDINPVQNPYVNEVGVHPPAAGRFLRIDRSAGARVPRGVIRADDVVVRAFARIGWTWGGVWAGPNDYQHFSAKGG